MGAGEGGVVRFFELILASHWLKGLFALRTCQAYVGVIFVRILIQSVSCTCNCLL